MSSDTSDICTLEPADRSRAGWFVLLLVLTALVMDGWHGRLSELQHQLLLLPQTALFLFGMQRMLWPRTGNGTWWTPARSFQLAAIFAVLDFGILWYESVHFRDLGYAWHPILFAVVSLLAAATYRYLSLPKRSAAPVLTVFPWLLFSAASIVSYPLNYLRSDMLPVILWADGNLLQGLNPYTQFFVANRIYDFPYLPGLLVAYLPFVALHWDPRVGSVLYMAVGAGVVLWAARPAARVAVAALLALLLMNPFLIYRHELYLQPHWLTWIAAFALLQRGRNLWALFVFGLGMAMYQFSWILLPFLLIYALKNSALKSNVLQSSGGVLRRGDWPEVFRQTGAALAGALLLAGPFLRSAFSRVANNTVGQWGRVPHATAEPMNLSYWVTFPVPASQLLRLQVAIMIGLYLYCLFARRCEDLADTLRWCIVGLTLFVMLNVLVDGYFFLMLLVPMFCYVCVANGWWKAAREG
jgi:hypothetical protein